MSPESKKKRVVSLGEILILLSGEFYFYSMKPKYVSVFERGET